MEQTQLTLTFDDVASCVAFANALEKIHPQSSDPFRIILPTKTQNFDNELLQLMITFMENKGYIPLTACILLLRDLLKRVIPDRSMVIVIHEKQERIASNTTDEEAKEIARKLTLP